MVKHPFGVSLYKENNMAESIAEMLAMETAEPDATLTPLDVFEEKSKDTDDAIEYGMGLSQGELLDIVMSVTPMGSVKAGKGAISFLKSLLGRAKSKYKFPVGYGEPTKGISELGTKKAPPSTYGLIDEALEKPKGIRQFGKFNRQLQGVVKRDKDISLIPLHGKKGFDVLDSGEMKHYRVASLADAQKLANELLKSIDERNIKHLLKSK